MFNPVFFLQKPCKHSHKVDNTFAVSACHISLLRSTDSSVITVASSVIL
ncbi:hypothetical protein AHF37_03687, partial [Paragonimus kellicotti]